MYLRAKNNTKMTYQETITYLFNSAPMFQKIGSAAYKEGLENTIALDNHFNNPHKNFRIIHIAGTNGKGSCSHTLASVLQAAGYKVGLFTSPHLIDFRERIRVNGKPISQSYVIKFVEEERSFFEPLHPSFFELTTAMAFRYFAEEQVDVAIIEVGLGGRLDCTNIVNPDLSIITNISYDHTQFLGHTLAEIATEKAGIIKSDTPIIIGESLPETKFVFLNKAINMHSPIIFADEISSKYEDFEFELKGIYQQKNIRTISHAIEQLQAMGYHISEDAIKYGFTNICKTTGLMGRWQQLQDNPPLVCDTGHNVAGITYVVNQLLQQKYKTLHIVIGMVNDKDVNGVLALLPQNARYYFTQASVARALPSTELQQLANKHGLEGGCYENVASAVMSAQKNSLPEDFIFVGGSNFIVADLLSYCDTLNLD